MMLLQGIIYMASGFYLALTLKNGDLPEFIVVLFLTILFTILGDE